MNIITIGTKLIEIIISGVIYDIIKTGMSIDIATIGTLIGLLGGFEGIKYFINRKTEKQKENASVVSKEVENLRATIELLVKENERKEVLLIERNKKVDALYLEYREEQKNHIETIKELNKAKLDNELLKIQKCEVRGCTTRIPPSDNY